MQGIGSKIKERRKALGYSLRALGDEIGVSHAHLSKIENEKKKPNLKMLEEISKVLKVNISYFFEEENEFTEEEEAFLKDVDLTDDELIEKYNLVIDGKKASKEEIAAAIQMIRTLRNALNKAR